MPASSPLTFKSATITKEGNTFVLNGNLKVKGSITGEHTAKFGSTQVSTLWADKVHAITQVTGDNVASNSAHVNNNMMVNGHMNVNNNMIVSGKATVNGDLEIKGASTVHKPSEFKKTLTIGPNEWGNGAIKLKNENANDDGAVIAWMKNNRHLEAWHGNRKMKKLARD